MPTPFAEVVVNVPLMARALATASTQGAPEPHDAPGWWERSFTYSVPSAQSPSLRPGQLVWVPFGARRLQGIVVRLRDSSPVEKTREILEIVDPEPFLSSLQLELAYWISRTYLAPLAEAVWLFLPPGLEQKLEARLARGPAPQPDDQSPRARELLGLVEEAGELALADAPARLRAEIDGLVATGLLVRSAHLSQLKAQPKRVQSVALLLRGKQMEEAFETLGRLKTAERLRRIIHFLQEQQVDTPILVSAIYEGTKATRSDLQRLEAAGIVKLGQSEVIRDPLAGRVFDLAALPELTEEQQAALHAIAPALPGGTQDEQALIRTFLLHGVTGSGKTEVYLRACAETLARGKQAIVLVPEIALTPQTIARFGSRFGRRVGVIHSDLSYGERYDTWRRVRKGEIDIVVGPRSALFAPLARLGLIVMDEEHEPSYKQSLDQQVAMPLYHTRAAALELARLTGAVTVLGSATPDVETYYRAVRGEFQLLPLTRRIETALEPKQAPAVAVHTGLPPVYIVDMRAELRSGNTSIFSRDLKRAVGRSLAAREQVILFLNRRGSATFVSCRDCGHVLACPRCGSPFTYHSARGVPERLLCHHCGLQGQIPNLCPKCHSARIRYFGAGTEKIENTVRETFPEARVLRWDRDATRGKNSHEAILGTFARHEADILVGTQMIAKGLDLPRVTLVGVISADTSLHLPDFRAGERTFQLLVQVAGRAGRSALGGQVIVQTYQPEHYAIQAAARHDYALFYQTEIGFRRELDYPPLSRLIRLVYFGRSEAQAQTAAAQLHRTLLERIRRRGLLDLSLIGPAPAFHVRLRGAWRYHLLIRGHEPRQLLEDFPLPLGWRIDVDPASLL